MKTLMKHVFVGYILFYVSISSAQFSARVLGSSDVGPRANFPNVHPRLMENLCNSKNCTKPESLVIHIDSEGKLWSQSAKQLEDHPLEVLRNDPRFEGDVSEADIEALIQAAQNGEVQLTREALELLGFANEPMIDLPHN